MALEPTSPSDETASRARPTPRDEIPSVAKLNGPAIAPLSLALIILCVGVAIYSNLGNNLTALLPLLISEYNREFAVLPEVQHGQIWRLVTPAFIHFGPVHLIFNMLWIKDLGTAVERRHGAMFLLALTVGLAAPSNLGQYLVAGPVFGGMSGVVYGLFGYIWLRSRVDPASGFFVPTQVILIMLGWFGLCWVGVIPHVANTAHGIGLVVGALCGAVTGRLRPTFIVPARPGMGV
jgi:GlpG protein